tara:strand:- start:510 stop:830 length:321 start_codon:yes stop_codon:yes gene_type:complete
MAITSLIDGDVLGGYQDGSSVTKGSLAGPASYATGGFAADIETDLGITEANILGDVIVSNDGGYIAKWDASTNKVYVYAVGAVTELAAAVNLSAVTFYLTVLHKGG